VRHFPWSHILNAKYLRMKNLAPNFCCCGMSDRGTVHVSQSNIHVRLSHNSRLSHNIHVCLSHNTQLCLTISTPLSHNIHVCLSHNTQLCLTISTFVCLTIPSSVSQYPRLSVSQYPSLAKSMSHHLSSIHVIIRRFKLIFQYDIWRC